MTGFLGDAPRSGALEAAVHLGSEVGVALDRRWDEAVRASPSPNATLSAAWLRALLPAATGTPVAVTVSAGHSVRAAGLFEIVRRDRLRVARPLAGGMSLVSPDVTAEDDSAAALLVDALLRRVHAVDVSCPRDSTFVAGVLARAPWARVDEDIVGMRAELPAPRLERVRAGTERDLRRAERAGVDVELRVASEPEAVAAALERLFVLHEERWAGRRGALSRFSTTEVQRETHRRAVVGLAAAGSVRLVEILEDGVVTASELALLVGRGCVFHTTAMRPGPGLRSPGELAFVAAVDEVVAAGATCLLLGQGEAPPSATKSRIGAERIPYARIRAARSPTLQHVVTTGFRARRRARHLAGRLRRGAGSTVA